MSVPVAEVLVTGATGFLGRALVARLSADGYKGKCAQRRINADPDQSGWKRVVVPDINAETDWSEALAGIDSIVHLAARVHVMNDRSDDPLAAFCEVNVHGTENLARQAVAAGARRLIYISSVKVNGESSTGSAFTESDTVEPIDPYGVSKLRAEEALLKIAKENGLEVVIIRPPLVYGPGVRANFLAMMRLLSKGIPLPFGAINNRRSLVGLGNLLDLIETCIFHPAAANQVFMVSDGCDLSTPELLRRVGNALGKPARLIPVPEMLLRMGLSAIGKRIIADRLCNSLQVDINKAQQLLGWRPPISVEQELKATAADFWKGINSLSVN